jgi:hypothetical protein
VRLSQWCTPAFLDAERQSDPVAGGTPRKADFEKLREIIVAFARSNGEPNPTDLRMIETTSTEAWALRGVTGNEPPLPVYVLIASGHFVSGGSRPRGAEPPTGTMLYMLVSREGLGTSGWGLGSELDFSGLGPVRRL